MVKVKNFEGNIICDRIKCGRDGKENKKNVDSKGKNYRVDITVLNMGETVRTE